MKILVIHCAYQHTGGESTVVQEEMQLLQSTGNNTRLLEFSNTGNSFFKLLQLPFNLFAYFKTVKAVRIFKPDVVHVHNLHFAASPSIIYAVKKEGVPIVLTLHNFRLLCPSGTLFHNGKLFLDSLNQKFCWSAVKNAVYKDSAIMTLWLSLSMRLHRRLSTWRIPNKYIVLSRHAQELFLHAGLGITEAQMTIKPNFTASPMAENRSRQAHFLFVGRLAKEKGIELLLRSFAGLPGVELRIAGDGPYKDEVIDYAGKFSNIMYVGMLDREMIYTELESCSALIFPSIWYEGMPLTIIEAFASATPVLASKMGAMQNMITHEYNGLHFNPDDAEDLRIQIEKWKGLSEEKKMEYGTNAFESYRQQYTPEKNAHQLLAVYNDVIAVK